MKITIILVTVVANILCAAINATSSATTTSNLGVASTINKEVSDRNQSFVVPLESTTEKTSRVSDPHGYGGSSYTSSGIQEETIQDHASDGSSSVSTMISGTGASATAVAIGGSSSVESTLGASDVPNQEVSDHHTYKERSCESPSVQRETIHDHASDGRSSVSTMISGPGAFATASATGGSSSVESTLGDDGYSCEARALTPSQAPIQIALTPSQAPIQIAANYTSAPSQVGSQETEVPTLAPIPSIVDNLTPIYDDEEEDTSHGTSQRNGGAYSLASSSASSENGYSISSSSSSSSYAVRSSRNNRRSYRSYN